jgi:hypothetical protein
MLFEMAAVMPNQHKGGFKMANKHFPKGLDDRMRDGNGEIHRKRGDTKVETLRTIYGPEFAPDHRSDAKLRTVLRDSGANSLNDLLKKKK